MDKGTFDKLIASPVDISSQEVSQLEDLLASFPYCQVAHLLVAKESHDKKSMLYPQKLRKASTYALDRRVLYNVINRKTYQETSLVHKQVVSVPEKKTTYESPPKSTNNQNSSFLRELEDNLKLLKEQTRKHDLAPFITPAPLIGKTESESDSNKEESKPATNASLVSPTLPPEAPESLVEMGEEIETKPLLEVLRQKKGEEEPVVQLVEPIQTSITEQTTEILEESPVLGTVYTEPEKASIFQPLDKVETLQIESLEETTNEQPIKVTSNIHKTNVEETNGYPETYSPDNSTMGTELEEHKPQFASYNDAHITEEEVGDFSSSQSFDQKTPSTFDDLQSSQDGQVALVGNTDQMHLSSELKPAIAQPIPNSFDFPSPTIVETKLGSELSFGASSGTEEIELFLAYLRKNAPIKAPAEVQNKIIEKFIENQPKITRHPAINFDQDNEDLAKSSISLRTELVTENYANILVKQNNIAKAIEVYKKLILKNPDKSAYFAAKLYELQSR